MNNELLYKDITDKILKAFFDVYYNLGYGFLEKVYVKALAYELQIQGLKVEFEKPIKVFYKDRLVGEFFADIIVENKVILELKAQESIKQEHEFQLINYLRATDVEVGLLLNFGKKPDFKRKVFTNDIKKK